MHKKANEKPMQIIEIKHPLIAAKLHSHCPRTRTSLQLLKQASCFLLLVAVFLLAPNARADGRTLPEYTYVETKRLILLVNDAAALIEAGGEPAFQEFGKQGSKWLQESYIFVYAEDGTVAYHPVEPELIGKNLIDFKDPFGKPVVEYITDIANQAGEDPAGWVIYHWEDETQLIPLRKGSYIRKVTAPNGKVYLVGSGRYNLKIEKRWVAERVIEASDLIEKTGTAAAFPRLLDLASPFYFLDTFIFVLDEQGRTLVDPAFPTMAGRNISDLKDAAGVFPIQQLLKKLKQQDDTWVQYLWPKPGEQVPSRKVIYARKIKVDGQTLIVGSDFFLASPVWMKG